MRSRSEKGKGTRVYAEYRIGHIDRIPLGDLGGVILQLVTMNPGVDFVVTVRSEEAEGELDTRAFREVLGDIPFTEPESARIYQRIHSGKFSHHLRR